MKKKNVDALSVHELLDRASIAFEFVEEKLIEHNDFKKLPKKIRVAITKASIALWKAYQALGGLEIENIKNKKI